MHMYYGVNFLRIGPKIYPGDHPYPITALMALPLVLQKPAPSQLAPGQERRSYELRVFEDPRNLFPPRRMNLFLGALSLLLFSLLVRK